MFYREDENFDKAGKLVVDEEQKVGAIELSINNIT
jgi:hypothetical protein